MSWNDKAYDSWKLASPYDDEPNIEIFKAEKYDFYTTDYDAIIKFDLGMIEAEKLDYSGYDSQGEFLEEYAFNLSDDLDLSCDEFRALEKYQEDEYNDFLDAQENGYRGKFKRRF